MSLQTESSIILSIIKPSLRTSKCTSIAFMTSAIIVSQGKFFQNPHITLVIKKPIIDTTHNDSQVSSVCDEEILIRDSIDFTNFPSLTSDHSIANYSPTPQFEQPSIIKCPTTKSYSVVVQSSLLQSPIKSFVTLQPVHHKMLIENFEYGQCSQNPKPSNLDESSPHFQNNLRIQRTLS